MVQSHILYNFHWALLLELFVFGGAVVADILALVEALLDTLAVVEALLGTLAVVEELLDTLAVVEEMLGTLPHLEALMYTLDLPENLGAIKIDKLESVC